MASLLPVLKQKFFDANGLPLDGGKLYSYEAGTSTPLATYLDETESSENTNPIILDANGEADIWIGALAYKFVLTDAADAELWTIDDVSHIALGSVTTAMIADLAVTEAKIGNAAVTNTKIQDNAVSTAKIQNLAVTTAKIADLAVTTAKINDLAVTTGKIADGAITLGKLAGSAIAGIVMGKNKIINGDFRVWQDGTNFPGSGFQTWTADRWLRPSGTLGSYFDVTQETDVPSVASAGRVIPYSLKLQCNTLYSPVDPDAKFSLLHVFEGFTFASFAQRSTTLQFWFKSNKTGIYNVSLVNPAGSADIFTAEFTVSLANTWEKKEIAIPASPAAGTWEYGSGVGLYLNFVLVCGTDYHTTAGAWTTGNYLATSNQVNGADSASNNFYIAGVQLETGSVATQFEERFLQQEIELCQRYYEIVVGDFLAYNTNNAATSALGGSIPYKVQKRATPTATLTGASYGRADTGAVIAATDKKVRVGANLITGSAGPAYFYATVSIDARL